MSYYLIAVGGTGNKILEALVYACAADALYVPDAKGRRVPIREINALIVDVDAACGNTTRAKQASEHYEQVRAAFDAAGIERRGFHTALKVERWNMNLAKRAASISGMTLNHRRDRLLAESLFSRTEAELEYSEGFRGHPDLGVLFFADLLDNLGERAAQGQPDEMVDLLDRIQRDLDARETVRVMLVGSIFGGTGASGIPSISRYLRRCFAKDADRFVLSAVMMLPYYDVPPATVNETLEIVVKSSAFLDKARTALQYYGMEGMIRTGEDDESGLYDALYLLGLPREAFVTTRVYSTGSQTQENDAHLLEWLAVRCTAAFFRTGFRGADAHNIDCYYYQWHSHDVSWECFDEEGALYHHAYGGLMKAAALYFSECYPTLRVCVGNDERRLSRTVNYWTTYFYDARKLGATRRAELEKLIDSFYRLMAFYANWMWQVLRTLPPTLRPEREVEIRARELRDVYRRLVDAQAENLRREAAGEEAGGDGEDRRLKARLDELIPAVGGPVFLNALQEERAYRAQRLDAQRDALREQEGSIERWENEDSHLIDPKALRQEKTRRDSMLRALAGMEDRAALVEADIVRAVEKHVADIPPSLTDAAPSPNGLFSPEGLETVHELLALYGGESGERDLKRMDALRRALWDGLERIVTGRVPDRRTAAQAVAGLGGGTRAGEGPQAAFACFASALLASVTEEENV
jgi:hypothetical protein